MEEDIVVNIPGVGEVAFPSSMSKDEINAAAKKLYEEAQPKTTKLSDVPGLMLRSTIQGVSAPISMVLDPLYQLAGREPASRQQAQALTALGLPEYPQTTTGRIAEAGTEALAGAGSQIGLAAQLAQKATAPVTRAISERFAAQPSAQLAATPPAAAASQATLEATGSPLAALAVGGATGAAAGIRTPQKPQFAKQLEKEANQAYKLAERAGLVVDQGYVKSIADRVSKRAFDEGYDPGLHPQVAAVLNRLADEGTSPKTLQELERLRRIVRAPGGQFANPDQQRIAANMVDEFDDMVESVGTQNVNVSGSKDVALSALTKARDVYKKSRKVSIIEDMVENATTRASQQTQAGLDNTLRNQFVNLSTNKKRMATFTKAEQDEITRIARGGGNVQQMLRFVGRFAVRGPVSGIFAGGASYAEPTIGIPMMLAAEGAKRGAESLRQRDVSRLMEQIAGRSMNQPSLMPITAARGLLSSQME
jgi:hypothetical protein